MTADHYVAAMGSFTPRHLQPLGIRVAIYPAKGVSVTVPAAGWEDGPKVPIIDDTRLFGLIRLGDRYRCSGSVEFVGYDTAPNRNRCQAIVDNVISVFPEFARCYDPSTAKFWAALATTLRRAATGFALALAIGTVLGVLVSRSRLLRRAFGALITGLQSMPSIAWFPFAILLFGLSEGAILFVVVIGASPSIANGLINGIDHVPPLLLRAGRVLGARGLAALRHVVLPAALPGYLAGLKQGWAFSWRSLMAGELLVILSSRPALGSQLQFARELSDAPGLVALMLVVLLIGILVDGLVFAALEQRLRRRRGLVEVGS